MKQNEFTLVDTKEAPDGYIAILKSSVATSALGNICRACDWRPECQNSDTDFERHNHRCMDFPIISFKTGKEIKRTDGCSVVFRRMPNAESEAPK